MSIRPSPKLEEPKPKVSKPSDRAILRFIDRVTIQIDLAKCIYATAALVGAAKASGILAVAAKIAGY